MVRFYRVVVNKRSVGSAVEHKEPIVQGNVVTKVTDSTTAGDYKIFVIDCDDAQHKANLTTSGVEELSEEKAVKLAAQYQPKRTTTQINPITMKEEKITVPACDLKRFLETKPKPPKK